MQDRAFKVGAVVALSCGGPEMTVIDNSQRESVTVAWFDMDKVLRKDTLTVFALRSVHITPFEVKDD